MEVDMYLDLVKYLDELVNNRPDSPDAVNFRVAQHTFPDLRAYKDHLGVVRLCSSAVNANVDTCHILHRTDGDGGSLEVMPFITDKQVQIFADPPIYVIGQRNPMGFGEVPHPDWRDLLEDAGLNSAVISKVHQYLARHPPISYHDIPD
jgi:sugar phosphate isomerase/epimerase